MDCTASTSMDEAGIGTDVHDGVERSHVLEAKHKIFLSHSGAQKSFVADLCADLKRRDRHPFFDKLRSSLPIGEKFPNLIFEAIEQCQVGVLVLSEEFFTRSKWPMLELVAMVAESRKPNRRIKIIPVFYSISRNRCRDPAVQTKWMREHWKQWEEEDARRVEDERRIDVEKWRSALGIFGLTTGLVMEGGLLDGDLRAEIVETICKEVPSETRWDDSGVEGKTRLCEEIRKKIYKGVQPCDLNGGVRVVGLYGMGGIGKTTACKTLCNELSTEYCDKVCHAELGSMSEGELYKKVLGVFIDLDVESLEKLDDVVFCRYLKTHIAECKVFLALDNVSDESKEQAKSILKANFGDGSVVLVTARSMVQLQRLGIKKEDCFGMPELEHEEAKSLFLGYAGMQENELDEGLLEKCVRRCYFSKSGPSWSDKDYHYHPLALRVLGSEVGDELRYDARRQAGLLRRIQTFNLSRQKEHPVFSILRSSFDSLEEENQLLFLDVALSLFDVGLLSCELLEWLGMVHGREVEDMLECLKRRSLLELFGESYWHFRMHDLWLEFAAAEIKAGKFGGRRLIRKGVSGTVDLTEFPKMGVVRLEVERSKDILALDVRGLKDLRSLEVIYEWTSGVKLVLKLSGLGTLEELTYLRCEGVSSSACIVGLGCLSNLQVVVLKGFEGDKLPDMTKLTNLRRLDLQNSRSLQSVCLRNLTSLTHLTLEGCNSLRTVDISGGRSLTKLRGLYDAAELVELNVSFCLLLPDLSANMLWAFKGLRKLRKLDITGCSSLEFLCIPRELDALEELRATGCESLHELPQWSLPKLRVLEIEPTKVPEGFEWGYRVWKKPRFMHRHLHNYLIACGSFLSHTSSNATPRSGLEIAADAQNAAYFQIWNSFHNT